MAASDQYRGYVERSFLRYSLSIISLLFVLVELFLFINIEWISAGRNKKNSALLVEILDRQAGDYEKGLTWFTSDYGILKALKDKDSSRATEINRLLYEFSTRQLIRCSFALTGSGGTVTSSNLFEGNRGIFLSSAVYQSLFERMAPESDRVFTLPSGLSYTHGQEGGLILSRAVSDSSGVLGYLFFSLPDEQTHETTRDYPLDDVIFTDRYDNLILSISRQSADSMEKHPASEHRMEWEKGNVVRVDGKHCHAQKEILPESTLVPYTLVSMEFQRILVSYGTLFLSLVGILMPVIMLPLAFRITRENLEAIDELQTPVTEMGCGNMNYKLKDRVFDEFKVLGDAFRRMVLQREELMLCNSELAEHKQAMEIKQLEEQSNPHFISNVLETLRYEIMIDGAKTSDIATAFASLTHYSIYYGSAIVPLQIDIENINDYLLLRRMRYNRRLNYHIDISEELLGCRIPEFLFQPVVESSFIHGAKDIHSVSITINAWMAEGNLKFCAEDNGSGISKKKLEELRKDLEQKDIYREHIGPYNPYRVVRLLHGLAYGMIISSNPGKDTRMVITLPAKMEDGYI